MKTLDDYLALPWSYNIQREDGVFIAYVVELPGICSDGETVQEAVESVQDAIKGAIKLYLEHGDEVPEPVDPSKFKGNIHYRTTPETHCKLAKAAQREGVSINKLIDRAVEKSV